ncbi:MAG: ABC transporter substrate-binding protein [Dokdonia sp.]|jgi:iron complex transport system substrate-binding protein
MRKKAVYILMMACCIAGVYGCQKQDNNTRENLPPLSAATTVQYASGFDIQSFEDHSLLVVSSAFPGSNTSYSYVIVDSTLSRKRKSELKKQYNQAPIVAPVSSLVVTSTTHIPSLEMLGELDALVGFPNLDYISSAAARKKIDADEILELGHNEALNTEVTIALNPDIVVGFGVEGQNKSLNSLEKAGIPVLYNGDWVETSPLGKAEWLKFFGVLFQKEALADSLFTQIAQEYEKVKKQAKAITNRPTVLSGAMYKDVWYLPHGNSWPAKLIADAGGNYLWANSEGSGSIALSVEVVLDKAQNADYWVAPGQYQSYSRLREDHSLYEQFDAFQNKKIVTFASKKGANGGVLYYELAPNRPDLVLKDMVYYLHPELLPEYTPYFFTPLEK